MNKNKTHQPARPNSLTGRYNPNPNRTGNRILAIDPGTREIGVAVLEGADLLFYGVRTIQHRGTPQELLRDAVGLITRLIVRHRPDVLAIERTLVIQQNATFLLVVSKKIKAAAKRMGLLVYEYPPVAVRRFICGTEKPTKQETARRIAEIYPHLRRHLDLPAEWERLYYAHIFDAIAVGLMCAHELGGAASKETGDAGND